MSIPKDRLYTKEHEWIKLDNDNQAYIGITKHAEHSLGDIVFVELPEVGAKIIKSKNLGVVESVKAVSDIYAPMSGTVLEINAASINKPELINKDPYGEGWLLKINIIDLREKSELLNPESYEELLAKEAK